MLNKVIAFVCFVGAVLAGACAIVCATRASLGAYAEILNGMAVLAGVLSLGQFYYGIKSLRELRRAK
jgi:hypothetical protein